MKLKANIPPPQLVAGRQATILPRMRHFTRYYVGGLLSLVILPVLLLLWTSESRKRAVVYGSIEVAVVLHGSRIDAPPAPEQSYSLTGLEDTDRLRNLQVFCRSVKAKSDTIYKLALPNNCSYGFFVQVVNTLRDHGFEGGAEGGTIRFAFRPDLTFRQDYQPLTWAEEFQFVRSELSQLVDSIKVSLGGRSEHSVRTVEYRLRDLGSLRGSFGDFYFSPLNSTVKPVPRSAIVFHSLGLWTLPIVVLWFLLLILSYRRARLLPKRRLQMTEHAKVKLGDA